MASRLASRAAAVARDPLAYVRRAGRRLGRRPYWLDGTRSAVPLRMLTSIQTGTFAYEYRGLPCHKNPFDLALYALLIGRLRPATIVEIGSFRGGSAVWLADQMRAHGIAPNVLSLDIEPPAGVVEEGVRFLEGDIRDLGASGLPDALATCPRPLLVIEDGPHTYEGSLAALAFFDPHLRTGEYIVVDDGILRDMLYDHLENGPNRAIADFLARRGGDYVIDREYCDLFGHNVTWNTNGYLRRVAG